MAAGRALVALLVCFAVAALLSAAAIERRARDMSPGVAHSVAMAATRPLAAVSSALALDRPGHVVQSLLGRSGEGARAELRPLTDGHTAGGGSSTSTGSPSPASTTLRRVTKQDPLILYVGGDSMAGVFAPQMAHMAEKTGLIRASSDFHLDSGLVRRDYFDWPLRLRVMMEELRPDAVVVLFGANDNQDIRTETAFVPFGSAEWKTLYRRRVDRVMALLTKDGRRVFWTGQPIMRSASFARQIRLMNDIYREEAARHPRVTYVDSWSLFATPDGRYSAYLRAGNGRLGSCACPTACT